LLINLSRDSKQRNRDSELTQETQLIVQARMLFSFQRPKLSLEVASARSPLQEGRDSASSSKNCQRTFYLFLQLSSSHELGLRKRYRLPGISPLASIPCVRVRRSAWVALYEGPFAPSTKNCIITKTKAVRRARRACSGPCGKLG
jgi:hypothetical protein